MAFRNFLRSSPHEEENLFEYWLNFLTKINTIKNFTHVLVVHAFGIIVVVEVMVFTVTFSTITFFLLIISIIGENKRRRVCMDISFIRRYWGFVVIVMLCWCRSTNSWCLSWAWSWGAYLLLVDDVYYSIVWVVLLFSYWKGSNLTFQYLQHLQNIVSPRTIATSSSSSMVLSWRFLWTYWHVCFQKGLTPLMALAWLPFPALPCFTHDLLSGPFLAFLTFGSM